MNRPTSNGPEVCTLYAVVIRRRAKNTRRTSKDVFANGLREPDAARLADELNDFTGLQTADIEPSGWRLIFPKE